jgi:hypothetical protein
VPEEPTIDRPPDPRLEDRVVELLRERPKSALAFNGLRRSLGAHPESLTRALRRLERYGLVVHEAGGYRWAGAGVEDPVGPEPADPAAVPPWHPVAEVELAPGIAPRQVLGLLAGRWAGALRWVGVYDRPDEPLLVWSAADGPGQVLLGIEGHRLRVYVQPPRADRPVPESLNAGARDLLVYALERLRRLGAPSEPPGHSAFRLGPSRAPGFGPN